MPIDFPANPTNGQVFSNWIYDSSITAWRNVNTDTGVAALNTMGLRNVVPTSVQVGSGSATVNANGLITFTSATSLSINGIFNSTYRNYKILIGVNQASALSNLWLRLRASGVDGTGPAYTGAQIINQVGTSGAYSQNGGANVPLGYIASMTSQKYGSEVTVHAPAVNVTSSINFLASSIDGTFIQNVVGGSLYDSTTIFDGFTLLPSTGGATFSGVVQVYGFTS